MDEKEKKAKEEDEVIDVDTTKDNSNKKNDKKKDRKTQNDLSMEEIENLLNQLKEQIDLDGENVKIIKIDRTKPTLKTQILEAIITYIFDFILIVSLNGYLKFTEFNILKILLFSFVFTTIELIIRTVLTRYFFRIIIASFGTILIPITIMSFTVTWALIPGLTPSKNVIWFFIIFLIIRAILRMFLLKRGHNLIEIKRK